MTVSEIAARNRAAKLEQLQRLRPKIADARAAVEIIRSAKENAGQARAAVETMKSLRHVPGFFPTPRVLVERMIREADIDPGNRILEPSAGKGDIAKAILGKSRMESSLGALGCELVCVELVHSLAEHLKQASKASPTAPDYACQWKTICADFLECPDLGTFDRVLMNPPFERGADVKHIRHAFTMLKPGGRLVAIASSTAGQKLSDWVEERAGWVEPLPAGSFATGERPTNVNTCLIVATNRTT